MRIFESFGKRIGVDLGTANTLIYLKGRGVVLNEPTIIAVNAKTGQILAIGNEAKKMLDRTPPHLQVTRPLSGGVVSDFEMASEIVRYHLSALGEGFLGRYGLAVLSVPTNLTEVERKSAEDVLVGAGASHVYLIEEPIASALGADLPVEEATANLIIDIGGGTTEIAVISVGGMVTARSLKIAGDKFTEDVIRLVRDEFKLAIGEPTAEAVRIAIGSALPLNDKLEMNIRGRDLGTGLPREVTLKNSHIRLALAKSVKAIAENVREVIEEAPPELVGDILGRGIYLSGGGSLLRGLDEYIEKEISVKTTRVEDPMTTVIRGLGKIVEEFPRFERILQTQTRPRELTI